uniref:Peptidyl-tRNA hydrolase n=2 Tax=Aegilops tauschii subsp. strangulata TaxID=200361 RepID=A0A453DUB3_AEGTS
RHIVYRLRLPLLSPRHVARHGHSHRHRRRPSRLAPPLLLIPGPPQPPNPEGPVPTRPPCRRRLRPRPRRQAGGVHALAHRRPRQPRQQVPRHSPQRGVRDGGSHRAGRRDHDEHHPVQVSARSLIGEVPVLLIKPQSYMNYCGEAIGPLAAYYQVPLRHILVIYDDMSLPNGVLRLQRKGGHGRHNGLQNVIEHLDGCREFPRLSIGHW